MKKKKTSIQNGDASKSVIQSIVSIASCFLEKKNCKISKFCKKNETQENATLKKKHYSINKNKKNGKNPKAKK